MPRVLDDVWRFDLDSKLWTEISKDSPVALPTPRLSHSMTVLKLPIYESKLESTIDRPETTDENSSKIVELDNWRAVTEDDSTRVTNGCENNANSDVEIQKYVEVLAIFGGMDIEGNFYNDLMAL